MLRKLFRAFLTIVIVQSALACSNDKKDTIRLESLNDISDKRIAVVMGTTQDDYACKTFPDAVISRYESASDMAISLTQGQVDAFLADGTEAKMIVEEYPELIIFEDRVYSELFGIGFGDGTLRDKFNIFLGKIKESGQLQKIVSKWENNPRDAVMPDFDFSKDNGSLKIGTNPVMMPFEYVRDGRYVGLDIEVVSMFCKEIQMTPEFSNMPFGSLIAALSSGKVDLICSGITITPERQKQVKFSEPYYESKTSMITLKKYVDGSRHKVIGVLMGSTQDFLAAELFPDAQLNRYENADQMVLALKERVCDQIVIDDIRGEVLIDIYPEFKYVSDSLAADSVVVVSSLQNRAIIDRFNLFLEEIEQSGLLDSISKQWFVNPSGAVMPPIPDGKNGILKIGTTAEDFPYSFIRDGKPAGLDVDMMVRFADYIGKKPEFQINTFSGMITSVLTRKVDIAANTIMPTEERKKQMSMSEPYLKYNSGLMESQKSAVSEGTFFGKVKESFDNNIVKERRYLLILNGLKVTLIISLLSILLGTILGGIICAMRMSKNAIARITAKVYIDILRGIPQVVLLMLMFYVVFSSVNLSGVIVASITFAMNFAAYVAEMFRTSIESISVGQKEAGIALGFSKIKTFIYIIMPQAVRRVLPVYKGEFISLVKMTSIVGYIAVQDLTKVGDIIRSRTFDAFFPLIFIAILYFLLAWLLTLLLNLVELKTVPKRGKE